MNLERRRLDRDLPEKEPIDLEQLQEVKIQRVTPEKGIRNIDISEDKLDEFSIGSKKKIRNART